MTQPPLLRHRHFVKELRYEQATERHPLARSYTPGFTENFASNEIIAAGLSAADVWPLLVTPSLWPSYYANSANVCFHDGKGPVLADGDRFYFETSASR